MSQSTSATVAFVKGAILAGGIAVGVSFVCPTDGNLATWISVIFAGLVVGLTMGKPIADKDSGPTLAVQALICPSAGAGLNALLDFYKEKIDIKVHDLTDGRTEYFSDHWIFVAIFGGLLGLLLTLDARSDDKN